MLVDLREFCGDVTARGGLDRPDYLTPEARRQEAAIGDLAGAVHDRKLARLCGQVFEERKRMWGSAPPKAGPRVYFLPDPGPPDPTYAEEDRRRLEQNTRQLEHTYRCQDFIEATLARVNRIERWVWWRG